MSRPSPPLCNDLNIQSVPFKNSPAKTFTTEKTEDLIDLDLFNQCQIVGHIAKHLIDRFPEELRASLFPKGAELLAASHKILNISPYFSLTQQKVTAINRPHNCPFLEPFTLNFKNGQCWGEDASIHPFGLLPKNNKLAKGQQSYAFDSQKIENNICEEKASKGTRKTLINALQAEFDTPFPAPLSTTQIIALSGLTTVAEWIGSGTMFDSSKNWQENITPALIQAGYEPFKLKPTLTFKNIFGFKARETQKTLIKACKKPGVYVLEAPMGIGKTEAALFCAYKMLNSKQATGIYFALPSPLVSQNIYERFNQFLTTVLAKNCPHRQALLAHGNAWLEETEMGEDGMPGNSWFNTSKRALLATFSLGTLEQVLMAAMNVRDGNVRAFGLAGKVVILDELHSYDAYTSVILKQVIALLRQLKCTVIILSATLSQARKEELLGTQLLAQSYPQLTAISNDLNQKTIEIPIALPASRRVNIRLIHNSNTAFNEALRRAEQGEQVLWIENTVIEAQERYFSLVTHCKEIGVACGLLHSHFLPEDRILNEGIWVNALGKSGRFARNNQGRIIVGTQVLEQSVDIDADFLISRFAPTDMLLQRLGRLWRHSDTQRPHHSRCEAWFLTPTLENAIGSPQTHFGATADVYSEYILCRSLEAWKARLGKHSTLTLPRNIRLLIDATYVERQEKEAMQTLRHHLYEGTSRRKGLNELRQLAQCNLSMQRGNVKNVQTQYNQKDTADILLLQSINIDRIQKQTLLTLCSGKILVIPWRKQTLSPQNWQYISATLMRQMVPCRQSQLPQTLSLSRCKQLGLDHALYLEDHMGNESAPFAIALTFAGEHLSGFEQALSEKYHYTYRQDTGLQITKK